MALDNLEDFLNEVDALADQRLLGASEDNPANSIFERNFSIDAFSKRLGRGYVIKDKRTGALLSFGYLLARRAIQKALLHRFMSALKAGGQVRFIVLKSRKLGVSTLTDMLLAEMAMQLDQWNSVIISHTKPAAKELFYAVRLTLERMEQAGQCPEIRVNNDEMVRFGAKSIDARQAGKFGHNATIQCVGAGDAYALSGQTPNALHMSECAKWDAIGGNAEQERFILSALGAVPKIGASFVVAESTANGQQGWFYNTWRLAVSGHADEDGVGWIPIFIPWFKDPDCAAPVPPGYRWDAWDEEDRAREAELVRKYGVTQEQLYFRRKTLRSDMNMNTEYWDQEYPESWEVAFIASGNGIFPRPTMERMRTMVTEPKHFAEALHGPAGIELKTMQTGSIRVWEDPQPGVEYIVGADTADGITFGTDSVGRRQIDASAFSVWKRTPNELAQVAECVSYADNFELGKIIAAVGAHYNNALINVERNRAHAVIAGLRAAEYPIHRMFRPPMTTATSEALAGNYFFQKNAVTSKTMIDTMLSWAAERLVPRSSSLVHELGALRRDERGSVDTNGRDITIAAAMAIIADCQSDMEITAQPGAMAKKKLQPPSWDTDDSDEPGDKEPDTLSYDSEVGGWSDPWMN